MKTIERPDAAKVSTVANRPWWTLGLVALVALVIGLAGGWLARGSDGDPDAVTVGGVELTDRQADMVDIVSGDYIDAWHAGDGEAVAAFFTDNGQAEFLGTTIPVAGGGVADYVDRGSWASLTPHQPVLVFENTVVSYHDYMNSTYVNSIDFTASGELKIVSHTISP